MKLFLHRSLFRRYLITTLVVIGALYAVVLIWAWNESADVDQAEQELAMPARALAMFSENTNAEESQKLGEQFRKLFGEFSKPAPLTDEVHYAVFRGGILLAKSDGAPMPIFDALIIDQPIKSVARGDWFIRFAQGTTPDSVVLFAVRQSFFQRMQRDGVIGAFTTVGLFLLVAAITAWVGSRFALTPIRELTRRILALDASRFDALSLDKPYAELNPVVTAINHRTDAIKAQVESERMFFSNAAHELRTPLAVISAQAFGVERAKTPDERAFRVQQLQSGVDRAAHSLGRMLQLAQLDSTVLTQKAARLKLGDVVADCIAFHAPRAFARGQTLYLVDTLADATDAFVFASQSDLMAIVDNLVENAINYAGEGATIKVEIGIEKRHWIYLSVTDDGPGFTIDDHATVFKRFHRGSQAECQPGTGLGLAIVKAAVQRMQGSVSAANRADGRGLEVKILIPEFAQA
jgi:two-component system, OmpR family, sensor histidine kinase QseC